MTDVVTYDVVPRAGVIDLGKQVEGLVTRVVLPNIRRGEGAVQLVHQRADDQKPYLVPITEDGDKVYWVVNRLDTAYPGRGQAELQWLGVNGEVAKSVTYQTNTIRSMSEPGAVPDEPLKPYTQAVARDAQAAKDAAINATEAARSAVSYATQSGLSAENAAKTLKKLEEGIASGDFRGQDGKSAYQLAVDAGFDGTETQWLESLKGAPGDTTAADAAAEAAKNAAREAQKAAESAVLYTEQHLTDSQQEQARLNIGVVGKGRQNILLGTGIGNPIAVDDAFSAPLCGLIMYGKSTQDGTPTPDAPVPIVSAGDGGSVAVTLSDGNGKTQNLTLPTPNGLPGVPATSGGNYTDSTGQQWVCDEVDLARGVKVQRIYKVDVDGENVKFEQSGAYCNVTPRGLPASLYKGGELTYAISTLTSLPWYFNKAYSFLYLTAANLADQLNASCKKQLGKVYYALATPIETPLTPAEIAAYKALTAYAPDTVVQVSDGAGLKLDYQRDVNIVIKNLEDAIASMTTT
nr:MAG TPA: hypothetical protein [Caudoviricetes sp.]